MTTKQWFSRLQEVTERFLTWRKRRRLAKKEKQKKKNPILDWLDAFIWAAFVVLLVNQYLLQAYQIPSSSMTDTLLVRDRIFVNKLIYGPELLPGIAKVPGFREPQRAEVIIFENPSYISKGPLFDIVQRILYMITLSLVDIDRDEEGNPKAHFLIKRAVGVAGDRLRVRNGEMEIRPEGEVSWLSERTFQEQSGLTYPIRRLINQRQYATFKHAGVASALQDELLPVPAQNAAALEEAESAVWRDNIAIAYWNSRTSFAMNPHDHQSSRLWRYWELGWYIPDGWVFPMGDNRDNSRDARFFGPVNQRNVLGRAMFIYWPPNRIGSIH
jgi:signal peptidase I